MCFPFRKKRVKKKFDQKLLRYKNPYFSAATLKKGVLSRARHIRTGRLTNFESPDLYLLSLSSSKLTILHNFFHEFGVLTTRDWLNRCSSDNLVVPSSNEYLSNLQLLTKKGSYCTWHHRTSHSSLFWGSTTWSGPSSTKVEFSERISSEEGQWNKNWGFGLKFTFKHPNAFIVGKNRKSSCQKIWHSIFHW